MTATDNRNVCVEIHEPELVTITVTMDQLRMIEKIMDVARQDECDESDVMRAECADLAEAVFNEITDAIKYAERHA